MLPNGDNAVVEIEKLANYCLNPEHPRDRNKARVDDDVPRLTSCYVL
ncbi:MAG: hypothetical protein ACKV2Q_29005 [Planctomycetaceae bacterium]